MVLGRPRSCLDLTWMVLIYCWAKVGRIFESLAPCTIYAIVYCHHQIESNKEYRYCS